MYPQALITAIVQQTPVLIAQISTAAGIRAPLARVADQVFLSLSREIEAQGVGRKVVADMFGLAIRAYQKKVQRLEQSQTMADGTLWEAVLEHVRAQGPLGRSALLSRFSRDPEREVTAVISDLVTTGMIYASGRGESTVYGATSAADRRALDDAANPEALGVRIWAHVFDHPGSTLPDLTEMGAEAGAVALAVQQLLVEGRLEASESPVTNDTRLHAARLVIPVGQELGWEVALSQHFRAVTNALALKVQSGALRAEERDRIGGATYTFGLHDGHPHQERVYGLLAATRAQVEVLFQEVAHHNEQHPEHEGKRDRVTFYFGQSIQPREGEASESEPEEEPR